MNVLLICSNGISSSLVVSRMRKYIDDHDIDILVKADNEDNLPYIYKKYDIILIAPQLAHHYHTIVNDYLGSGKAIAIMPQKAYGLADGANLVHFCQDLFQQKNPGGKYTFEEEMLQMIAGAGKAKQLAYEALTHLEKSEDAKAKQLLKNARAQLLRAHQIQSAVISSMMDNENPASSDVSILMVHAQDQVSGTENIIELTDHLIRIFERRTNNARS